MEQSNMQLNVVEICIIFQTTSKKMVTKSRLAIPSQKNPDIPHAVSNI
jgi:hypothetical protein